MSDENEFQLHQQQQHLIMSSTAAPPPPPPAQPQPPNKKRRNQPGNPNPDSEVIALSPTTLMAKNRFVCEVCNKGFQREQNLQLHRRGHNLPWKLKQKSTKDIVKRKVYLCPEPTCIHHDPARALGDLTGIKKHYSRKHGEKKYKCEKCSKKYAVQSDWKAHSKICGTKEYRCDCGTLFSRRDSFVTHRAFCDALAQETSARNLNPPSLGHIGSHLLGFSHSDHPINHLHKPRISNQDHLLQLGRPGPQFETLTGPGFCHSPSPRGPPLSSSAPADLFLHQHVSDHEERQSPRGMLVPNNKSTSSSSLHGLMQLNHLQMNNANSSASSNAGLFNLGFFAGNAASGMDGGHHHSGGGEDSTHLFSSGNFMSMANPSIYSTSSNQIQTPTGAHMSATALLQKAAQLGSTTTNNNNAATSSLFKSLGKSSLTASNHSFGVFEGNNHHHHLMHDLVNSMAGGGASSASIYDGIYATDQNHDNDGDYRGYRAINHNHNKISFNDHHHQHQDRNNRNDRSGFMSGLEQAGGLTRDFLGVGEIVRNVREQHNGVEMSSLDHSQGKSSTSQSHDHSFGGGSF
ncbi:hypothetical protein CASFOL_002571 [Castilleja foliolosa]|uniref:C2H2-type domain-containing protein n=1 Tax=Castilleja foliolosa TaxID=1961234 RepID=A0ABD3EEN9_9LAMI